MTTPPVPPAVPPAVRAVAERAPEAGIFLDFDGCLAPIMLEPSSVRAVPGASSVLQRLARHFGVVAIISGRSVSDLARLVRAPDVRLVGQHGMEERRDGAIEVEPAAAAAAAGVERAASALERALGGLRGVRVERKGLALSVHFRRAPDPEDAETLAEPAVEEAARQHGLAVVPGRRVLELRPTGAGDKGQALRRIAREASLSAALVCGDDVGDIPSFRAARELPVSACVAVRSDEAPAGLLELADAVLDSPREMIALLRALVPG